MGCASSNALEQAFRSTQVMLVNSRFFTIQRWIRAILQRSQIMSFQYLMKTKWLYTLQSTLGVAVSAVCAIAVALVFSRTPWKLAAPFLFAALLVLLASRFGALVSVVGSLLAALIFAEMLFAPLHSLQVENDTERATLAWMILLSVSASYLLFPSRTDRHGL